MFCSHCGAPIAPTAGFCAACGTKSVALGLPVEPVSLNKPSPATPPPSPAMPPPLPATPPPLPPLVQQQAVPEGVKGWSWGAFLLNWIWAIGNRSWIGLLALIPYVGVLVAIWLGFKGREMAWKNKQWDSFEHFDRVQKKWSRWGVGVALACLVLGIVGAIALPAYQVYQARASAEQSSESLDQLIEQVQQAEPMPPAPVAAAVTNEQGVIDSNADTLPAALVTVAGTLARMSDADGNRVVTLDGKALFSGEDANWQFPVRSFALSNGKEAVLMASSGGRGNSCETLFFFLIADASGVTPTPLFGTCAPQGRFEQRGDAVVVTLPQMGGHSTIALTDGAVVEDGKVLAMDDNNNPAK